MAQLKNVLEHPHLLKFEKERGDESDEEMAEKERSFEMKYKPVRKQPIMKLIKATDNINKYKKNLNKKLVSVLKRLDLDRPLMLREKLDVLWTDGKSQDV